ncbi:hypothetical protein JKP88DRAFT_221193, partial [Tribonema minus]
MLLAGTSVDGTASDPVAVATLRHVKGRCAALAAAVGMQVNNWYLMIRGKGDSMHFHMDGGGRDDFVIRVSVQIGDGGSITFRAGHGQDSSVTVPLQANEAYMMNGHAAGKGDSNIHHGAPPTTSARTSVVIVADLVLAAHRPAQHMALEDPYAFDLVRVPALPPATMELLSMCAANPAERVVFNPYGHDIPYSALVENGKRVMNAMVLVHEDDPSAGRVKRACKIGK